MSDHPAVAADIIERLRAICLGLPEADEQAAWTGTRWCIRDRNFAHVLALADGWPPAYAQAANHAGPATLLTFRAPPDTLEIPRLARAPFFRPPWFADIVGMTIDAGTDWDVVESLLVDSYRLLAPKKLAALVERFER
jgi:hypothetical protein